MALVTTVGFIALRIARIQITTIPSVSSKHKIKLFRTKIPWWRTDVTGFCNGPAFWKIDYKGEIRGDVQTDGTFTPYAAVYLYYTLTGLLIEKTLCDVNGVYSFSGLDRASDKHAVVAYIPPLQALIFDKIIPL